MPTVVFDMLKHVDVAPGHAVLEIGTGSGWNAALLAHRLGAERVTTVEVDTWVAARARKALSDAGYGGITAITGDGEHGCPSGAPFDRILSTAQCQRVPWAWVDQSRPGGKIVTPWGNEYVSGLLSLTVGDGVATGGIVSLAWFMEVRGQRLAWYRQQDVMPPEEQRKALPTSWTTVHPHYLTANRAAQLWIGLAVPDCRARFRRWEDGGGATFFTDVATGSWATLRFVTDDATEDRFALQQGGPRRLWDEVERAYRGWVAAGRPSVDSWRFTVGPEGQRIELA
jgi:protein-L-isoaspartate O-methyltransferase